MVSVVDLKTVAFGGEGLNTASVFTTHSVTVGLCCSLVLPLASFNVNI